MTGGSVPPNHLDTPHDGGGALAERLGALWARLDPCLEEAPRGFRSLDATRAVDETYAKLTAALETHPVGIAWDVTPTAFELAGAPIWTPSRAPFDRVPQRLFAEGLRRIRVEPGVTREELVDLVAILVRPPPAVATEDDAPSELWERAFAHVSYVAADDDVPLEAMPDVAEIAARARAAATRVEGVAPTPPAIPAEASAALAAQLGVGEDVFGPRFVDALADGYVKARGGPAVRLVEGAVREWAEDPARDPASIFELFEAFAKALAARAPSDAAALEREAARVTVPATTLRRLLTALASEGDDPWTGAKDALPASVVSGVSRALAATADSGLLDVACRAWSALPEGLLRDAIHGYVRVWAVGNEARLGAELEAAGPELGVALVGVLASLNTAAALTAVERAAKSREIAVRIEALIVMPAGRDEYVRTEAKRLLHDPDAAVWGRALAVVTERGLLAAGPALVAQIQAPGFHERPVEERRVWMRGLAKLSPRRAEELCVDLIGQTPLIPSETLEQSRVLAAEILGESGSTKEALAVCEDAAKKRWRNTQVVRDAAERAALEIGKRLQTATPEPPTSRRKPEAP